MADWNDPLPGSNVGFWSIMACAAGSLLSLRTVVETTPAARMMSVAGSFMLAFFIGPAVAEHMGAKPSGNLERAIMLLTAFVGVNLLAGLATFLGKWRADPQAAVEWLFSLWRGGPR
jgi:hypothetical protein